jgi:hypothetical protein
MCRLSWNLGASTSWNPQGLSRPVVGLLCFTVLTIVQIYLDLNKCLVYFVGSRFDNCVTFLRQKCLGEANCRFLIRPLCEYSLEIHTRNTTLKYFLTSSNSAVTNEILCFNCCEYTQTKPENELYISMALICLCYCRLVGQWNASW